MMNTFGRVLKMFVIIGVLVVALLYILLVTGAVAGAEFQDTIIKAIEIIGTLTVASIVVVFVTSLGNKN